MNQGKFPVVVVPVISAAVAAAGVAALFFPGGILGAVLAVVLLAVGACGLSLWWKVLRNPQAMVEKLLARRGILEDRAGRPRGTMPAAGSVKASDADLNKAIDMATGMLGGNRAARRAAEAAAKKATGSPSSPSRPRHAKPTNGRVTPKKQNPAG